MMIKKMNPLLEDKPEESNLEEQNYTSEWDMLVWRLGKEREKINQILK